MKVSKALRAMLVVSFAISCAYLVSCGSKSPSDPITQTSSLEQATGNAPRKVL